ncbi:uncharacterized protein YjbK [Bacillus mesophilus]|uniref:CYTH domain-containing protein n=1 Tax=Bacillus mesophilus TaxID=1808955 RepID=A0A6M0Q314_9BACI|nr:CYTH domain-containing protein [Bacillus mesophilus]MBM7659739.1 uncharacterized protein YjbK [Bacillus mesophilus]NEY70602.1 CYTH domain-containing protein [Bacillus mesophilus]
MNQEIEIEFKNLVTKEEFEGLLKEFSISNHQFILQQNHYFDTTSFSLKDHKAALRIRYKNNSYTLTLKQTINKGILETHQDLSENEAQSMLQGGLLIQGDIRTLIDDLNIDSKEIQYLGTLETNRAETNYLNGTLVFDHSHYLNKNDYEIEYEVTDYEKGLQNFNHLLQKHQIDIRETNNKIQRFFIEKQKGMGVHREY